jgi:ABC-type dipeptide/oligopeptide/nickel transport system permease subunit
MGRTLANFYLRFFGTKKYSALIGTMIYYLGCIMDILGIILTINVSIPVGIMYIILTVCDVTYLILGIRLVLLSMRRVNYAVRTAELDISYNEFVEHLY